MPHAHTVAHTVDWTPLDHTALAPVQVGDMVSAEAGGLPIYRVMALDAGRAWVASRPGAPVRAMPLEGFRWRGVEG